MSEIPRILAVDDEAVNLEIIGEYLSSWEEEHELHAVEDGLSAWKLLENAPNDFDVVLLDRMMPGMDGMQVLEKMSHHPVLKHIPVILQTAKASNQDILEGMQAGAYYYLTKPYAPDILRSVTSTALKERIYNKTLQANLHLTETSISQLKDATFEFSCLSEVKAISSLLAGLCPNPRDAVTGLYELMLNAVEHGNLEISYEEKSKLKDSNIWEEEIERRLALSQYADRKAILRFQRETDGIQFVISDQGQGFDWQLYMDFNPERIMDNHGRGIAIANKMCFDKVEYFGKGNTVKAFISTLESVHSQECGNHINQSAVNF